jgi:hypothetical protein
MILIERHRYEADVVVQIVKHQVGALHAYDENQVMLSRRQYDLRQQQFP